MFGVHLQAFLLCIWITFVLYEVYMDENKYDILKLSVTLVLLVFNPPLFSQGNGTRKHVHDLRSLISNFQFLIRHIHTYVKNSHNIMLIICGYKRKEKKTMSNNKPLIASTPASVWIRHLSLLEL